MLKFGSVSGAVTEWQRRRSACLVAIGRGQRAAPTLTHWFAEIVFGDVGAQDPGAASFSLVGWVTTLHGSGLIKASQRQIAEEAGVHRQAANSAFKALTGKGIIVRQARSRYALNAAFLADADTPPSGSKEATRTMEYRATRLKESVTGSPTLRMIKD